MVTEVLEPIGTALVAAFVSRKPEERYLVHKWFEDLRELHSRELTLVCS